MRGHRSGPICLALMGLLSACSGEGPEAESGRILTSGEKRYSNQDVIIRDFFHDRRGGFFVDIGAYHWKDGSNTLYLERHLDWTGIAVDALAYLEKGYAENRPGTRFFNYLVGESSSGTGTIYVAGPLSSTKEDHLDRYPGMEGVRGDPVEVPRITLDDLLERAGVVRIDFLNMDIEEAEPAALSGFDIERFLPELVCVEASSDAVRAFLKTYFADHGYERIDEYLEHDPYNWYFRRAP